MEVSVSILLLVLFGVTTFRGSIQSIEPRNWTIAQTMTDAYLSQEIAFAQRIPLSAIIRNPGLSTAAAAYVVPNSPYQPLGTAVPQPNVVIGTRPSHLRDATGDPIGNRMMTGSVIRTLLPSDLNTVQYGGMRSSDYSGDPNRAAGANVGVHIANPTNPVNIQSFDLQITLVYTVNQRSYTKTRVVRRVL